MVISQEEIEEIYNNDKSRCGYDHIEFAKGVILKTMEVFNVQTEKELTVNQLSSKMKADLKRMKRIPND